MAASAQTRPFRLHLLTEPSTLDPQAVSTSSGSYFHQSLYRGIYRFDANEGLKPDGAKACRQTQQNGDERVWDCELEADKWSDGSPIEAKDYVRSFRRLIDPKNASPQADLIFLLKNARRIWQGQAQVESLGIQAVSRRHLRFVILRSEDDGEFLYRLIQPALSPQPPGGYPPRERARELKTNGPYSIQSWQKGVRVSLKPNPHARRAHERRPNVEALFIEEDSTAQRLFDAGKLDLLRRVVTSEIPRYKNHPGFFRRAMARFDYVGFSPKLDARVRKALVESPIYNQFPLI